MPTTTMTFTETDLEELVANEVRRQHKLAKAHAVKTMVVIDRDAEGAHPKVSVTTEFIGNIAPRGAKG